MVSGILTLRQTVCGSLHGGAAASSNTGAAIGIVEPKFGPESTTMASGVPQPPTKSPATTTRDQRSFDVMWFVSAGQKPYCSPKSTVARLTGMSSTLLGLDPPALAA